MLFKKKEKEEMLALYILEVNSVIIFVEEGGREAKSNGDLSRK